MIFKILIVDDEMTMRKGLSNYMNWASIDCQVTGTASDGMEAMEFLQKNPVDIVITDIKMPVADGLEVARFVYEQKLPAKVIILTGYADFAYAQTAIRYQVTSFILKPTNKKELFAAVQEAQKQLIVSQQQENIAKDGLFFLKDQVMLVKDVHQFPGHIACDSASNSEIVIPLHKGDEIVGVLDIDSPLLARFDEEDTAGLTHFAQILETVFND